MYDIVRYIIDIMLKQVAINRDTGDGKNGDVLDVAEYLATTYGSATNAIVQMCRRSPLFKQAFDELKLQKELAST